MNGYTLSRIGSFLVAISLVNIVSSVLFGFFIMTLGAPFQLTPQIQNLALLVIGFALSFDSLKRVNYSPVKYINDTFSSIATSIPFLMILVGIFSLVNGLSYGLLHLVQGIMEVGILYVIYRYYTNRNLL